MKIIRKQDAVHVTKPEGTTVDYYLRNEYEIHVNEQAPKTTQTWHHHEKICESLFILKGELTAQWKEGSHLREAIVREGDLIETEHTSHTFTNHTNQKVMFIVIKQVLSGEDKRDLFKTDKIVDKA